MFRYNEAGSIAACHISPEKATELSNKVRNSDKKHWRDFLGDGDPILDGPSQEYRPEGQASNIGRCENLLEINDWVVTGNYIGDDGLRLIVEISIELTRENIDDIMCAALKDGISHWCSEAKIIERDYYGEYAFEQISRGGSLQLFVLEENKAYILDLIKLVSGFKLWVSRGYDVYGAVKSGEIDCCKIDAEVADAVVQCALFGDIVYG